MKHTSYLLLAAFLLIFITACGDEPEVEVSVAPVSPSQSTFAITRLTANLLNRKPLHEMDKPDVMMMINQGDQILPIQDDGNWTQVQHVLSGNIGWLHKSFVQVEERSKWWSGDTDRARQSAERIYQDKVFMENEWPIAHVNIEERWNKLVFNLKRGEDFTRDQAVQCAQFGLSKIKEEFPSWRDHQVFLNGRLNGQDYTLVLTGEGNPTFL